MYSTIESTYYQDAKVRKWGSFTRDLATYFMVCPHRNLIGCYILPLGYIQIDLGWDEKQLSESLARLEADGFVSYDRDAQMLCITNYLKYHPMQNPNYLKSAIKLFNELPWSPVLESVEAFLSAAAEQYGVNFIPSPCRNPSERVSKPTRNPSERVSKQGTGTGTGTGTGKGTETGTGKGIVKGKTQTLKTLSNNFISTQSQNPTPTANSKHSPSELPNPSVSQNPYDAGNPQVKGNGEMPQAVRVYQRLTGITLGLSRWSDMDRIIGEDPDALLKWERVAAYWMKQGLDLKRTDLMLEYYVKGIVP